MLPASPILLVISLIGNAIEGMVIGVLIGWLTSLATRIRPKRPYMDALIGALGSLIGMIGISLMPWHPNTVSYVTKNGVTVTTTANFYQHPERVAATVATILPLLFELNRLREARRSQA